MKPELNPDDTLWENNFLKHLQFIASVLGLAIPNLHTYTGLSVWYIFYSIVVIALLVAVFSVALLLWIELFKMQLLGTIVVLNCMCLAIVTFSNIVGIVFAVIVKRKSTVQLVKQLKDVDKAAKENQWNIEADRNFSKAFIGLHVSVLLQVAMEATFYTSSFGLKSLTIASLNGLLMYIHTINVLQISSFPLRINHRCVILNGVLHDLLASSQKATQVQEIHKILDDTRLLLKIYDSVCDMFEFVSRSYGTQMMLVVCVSVVFIVEGFNTCIKISVKKINLKLEYPTLFINLSRCLLFAILCGVMSVCCALATDKMKAVRVSCHRALINIGACPKNRLESTLSGELSRFVQHLERRKVHFSAAGCFDIDYATIFTIFGSVASYIVIILQFD